MTHTAACMICGTTWHYDPQDIEWDEAGPPEPGDRLMAAVCGECADKTPIHRFVNMLQDMKPRDTIEIYGTSDGRIRITTGLRRRLGDVLGRPE